MFYLVFIYDKFLFFQINPSYYHMLEHLLYNDDVINQITKSEYIVCQYVTLPKLKLNHELIIDDEKTRIYEELTMKMNNLFKYDNFFYLYDKNTITINKNLFNKIFIYNDENESIDVIHEKKNKNQINIYNFPILPVNFFHHSLIKFNILIPITNNYSLLTLAKVNHLLNNIKYVKYVKYNNSCLILTISDIDLNLTINEIIISLKNNTEKLVISLNDYIFNYESKGNESKKKLITEIINFLNLYKL